MSTSRPTTRRGAPSRSSSRALSAALSAHTDHHRRASLLALATIAAGAVLGAVVVGAVASFVLPVWVGAPVGAIAGAALVALWHSRAEARVLRGIGAIPVATGAEPRLRNLVDGLCISNGIPVPDLAVVDSDALNSLVVGRSPERTTLVFTRGLLDGLDRIELEGVVARLLAQVKHGEAQLATVVTAVAQLGSRVGVPRAASSRWLPERYDVRADLDAVALTRYPPGLTAALEKMRGHGHVPGAPRATAPLWLDDPSPDGSGGGEAVEAAHSSIDERIATLQEL